MTVVHDFETGEIADDCCHDFETGEMADDCCSSL